MRSVLHASCIACPPRPGLSVSHHDRRPLVPGAHVWRKLFPLGTYSRSFKVWRVATNSAGFFRTFRVVKMRLKKWRIVSNRHDPPPKWRAAVCGRAGPRGRFLSVLRQFASSLSPRGVYFIIRRPERHERTRRRDGFDAAPPHGQDYFWGEN